MALRKYIIIGDIHADFEGFWKALRAAGCLTADGQPTPPVRMGHYQIVLMGDLAHPKSQGAYDQMLRRLLGGKSYNFSDPQHQALAASVQIEGLRRMRDYHQAAGNSMHIILGNHDAVLLDPLFLLGTASGLRHTEFDPRRGGVALPEDLCEWVRGFLRELRVGSVQFAHVGPLPAHSYYDDLFYADKSSKRWFLETPEYVARAGLGFGVYGHTQMERGIVVREDYRFALVDALHKRQYLELMLDSALEEPVHGWRVVQF